MRVIRETVGALQVAVSADEPLAWAPLVEDSKLISVQGEVHIVGKESSPTNQFMAWGLSGYIVPVVDPLTEASMKVTWDTMVVKSEDPQIALGVDTVDYDWVNADTNEIMSPGEMRIAPMLGMGEQRTKEITPPRLEFMSFAKGPQGGFLAGSPDTYQPTAFKTFKFSRTLLGEEPSYAMLTVTNVPMGDAVTVHNTFDTSSEWGMLKNLDLMVADFWRVQVGMIELGAEDPFERAVAFIADLVTPDVLDESSTSFDDTAALTALVYATWVIDYPDNFDLKTLDGR